MRTKRQTYPKVADMYSDALYVQSIDIDWRERMGVDMEGFESYECETCDKCEARVLVSFGGDCSHSDHDGTDCDGWIGSCEGPMMSYYYPIPGYRGDRDDARMLEGLPLALVRFSDGEWALALTGGGMDLSWEICEGFMRLGYLPPLRFCTDLPDFAGDTYKRRAYVLKGAARACTIAGEWAKRGAERVRDRAKKLRAAARAA